MKKAILATLMALLATLTAVAQQDRTVGGNMPAPTRYNVSFESQHGESFSVYIDGDLVNRMPQSRVTVNDIGDQTHEVVVVLKRPAEKASVLMLRPGEANVTVNVNYDMRQESLYLYTPAYNRPDGDRQKRKTDRGKRVEESYEWEDMPLADETDLREATDDDVEMMVLQLKAQPFDNERLALAKTLVCSAHFTAQQIARMCNTIDFSNSQVEFLKYAYSYCSDLKAYGKAIEVLTFNSDRKKVTDYIATRQ